MKINPKSLLYGTLMLTGANLIVRILGFIYRVYLSRLIGPQGMGLIQLVFPAFLISITLTTSGLPIAVSRLVSEKNAKGDTLGIRRTVSTAILLVAFISIILSVSTILNLNYIADNILKDQRTRGALLVLFPSIIIIGFGAVLKGFFYGMKDIHPPALSEIIEQLVRMGIVFTLLYWLAPMDNLAIAAGLVMLGTVFGEMASLLFLHYRYYKTAKIMYKDTSIIHSPGVLGSIMTIAIPITMTRLVSSFMSATNSILIPQRLMASGMLRDDAIGLFGIMFGMVMPLLFLPFTITGALSVVIIPNLSENLALNNWHEIKDKVSKAIMITCITAFPIIALLVSLGKPIGDILYKQPMVGILLVPMSYALLFHSLQHTTSGILNGLGKQNRGATHFIIGSAIQLLCTYFLISNPSIRIYGIIIGFSLSSIVVCTLNLTTVLTFVKMPFLIVQWILKPGFSALIMASVIGVVYQFIGRTNMPLFLNLIISFLLGLSIFFISLFALGGIPIGLFSVKKKVKI